MSRCLVLVVAFCACLLLGGCGKEAEQPAPQVVHLYTWEDYFPETVFEAFTAETGIRVEIAYYPSNEVLMIQLERGQPADVILPSDYMVETLAQKEMLAPLDKGLLPNIKHLDPRFANPDWDSEGKYAVPLFYGSTGIAYGPEITSEEASSWAVMFNIAELQRLRGRMTMLEDKREALGAALIYLGFSPNTVDPEELQKAAQLLVLQKPYLDAYNSEQYLDDLATGNLALAQAWSGDAIREGAKTHGIRFAVPEEGAVVFVDALSIPVKAANPEGAHQLINYLMRPEVAAELTTYSYFPTTNAAASELVPEAIRESLANTLPPPDKTYRLKVLGEEADSTYEHFWQSVR